MPTSQSLGGNLRLWQYLKACPEIRTEKEALGLSLEVRLRKISL